MKVRAGVDAGSGCVHTITNTSESIYNILEFRSKHSKLVIYIYYSNEDMVQVIEYIHFLKCENKLYIRHYSKSDVETVAYAIWGNNC